jgi:hypothetical protein
VRGQRLRRLPTITDDVRLAAADPLPDALLASDQADTVGQPPRIDREEAS